MEETEKMRYMNFVTLGRRHRAQSAVVPATQPRTITHPESISTVDTATMEMTNAHRPLTHANSIPLSSSQEVTHVKDDLQQTQRKRSNSFAGVPTMNNKSCDGLMNTILIQILSWFQPIG